MKSTFIELSREKNKDSAAVYFRKRFLSEKAVRAAKMRITALGIYKAFVNGHEIDEQVFLPGRTSYKYRVQYQEYDVTSVLYKGGNVIAVVLGKGWYKGNPQLYCELTLDYEDGTQQIIPVDSSWRCVSEGPVRFHDMKLGEIYDARKEMPGWKLADFDDVRWPFAAEIVYQGELIPQEGEKILEHERLKPIAVLRTPDGSTVLDFGQNLAGYMEFSVTGSAGTKVELIFGETLDENGNFTVKNLGFSKNKKTGCCPQTIQYILKEGKQCYKPQCSIQGFQYVKLVNWPESVAADNFTSIAVYSDLEQVGSFACSNEKVNKLVENIRWSTKSNFLDVPTDCPTRERAGWTGDIMVYSAPVTYQMDTYHFLKKWLKDVILEQGSDGRICNIVPDGGMPVFMDGAAGWSDAIVKLPWILYQFYGEKEILEMAYPAIQRHIAFMQQRAKKRKPWHTFKKSHWDYLIDTGFHWGEWLEPGSNMPTSAMKGFIMPDAEVASAYYAWSTGKAARIAEILEKNQDAKNYACLHQNIVDAYRKEFLPDGMVHSKRQCRYVRPVALKLVPEEQIVPIVEALNRKVMQNDYCVGTGFLSTPHICEVLSDYGCADTAYRMLENEKAPSWLYEVTKGATSIWENWYGKDEKNKPKNSLNHYSPGAVIGWLYSRVAGIRPLEPGFEKILIAPVVGGTITWVECSYQSVKGKISSGWYLRGGQFELNVEVPCAAHIVMPNGETHDVDAGKYHFECNYQ